MLAMKEEGEKEIDFKQNNGFVSNHPKCQSCGGYARPAYGSSSFLFVFFHLSLAISHVLLQ